MFSVKDKVVVVTGGGSGIGLMISRGFVQGGARVYITSRKASVLEKTAQELTAAGPGTCIPLECDLQSLDQTKELAAALKEREPAGIHVLVNNSGANWATPTVDEYPDAAFTKLLTLNVQRVFSLVQELLPLLEAAASQDSPARVINIGSIDGIRVPGTMAPAYSASKAAVHQLTRVLAGNLGPRGIAVTAVAPGPFQSHMMKATLEKHEQEIVASIPLGRIGRPLDMAGICIFLASDAGAYINGAIIPVDGGMLVANQTYTHANM
ncbi:hypothetical protein GGF46_004478 [Coemansia sp. RSA 552]|nr:hypothetical protein GGF46_004478 [Coemansia sp. RSA 552]